MTDLPTPLREEAEPAAMSAEARKELARLAAVATPGPWAEYCGGVVVGTPGERNCSYVVEPGDTCPKGETANYIAAASPDVVQALLAEVARLQERNAMLGGALDDERRDTKALIGQVEESARALSLEKQRAAVWVLTGERLPETGEGGVSNAYLVCVNGEPTIQPHIYIKSTHRKNAGFWMEVGRAGEVQNVTHWMEYPGRPTP